MCLGVRNTVSAQYVKLFLGYNFKQKAKEAHKAITPILGGKFITDFYFLEGTLPALTQVIFPATLYFPPLQMGKLRPTEVIGLTEAYPINGRELESKPREAESGC